MPPISSLLGPPEIYDTTQPSQSSTTITTNVAETISDPFINLMVSGFNTNPNSNPNTNPVYSRFYAKRYYNMGLTENCSPTFLTTSNPCLDFFFHVVPNTPPEEIKERLRVAWDHDPLTTLKFVCNLRGVRGTGKSDKEGFYTAAFWLHQHHPKTLACNIGSIADFGYFKDLPEIIFCLLEGSDVRRMLKTEWMQKKWLKISKRRCVKKRVHGVKKEIKRTKVASRLETSEERDKRLIENAEAAKEKASELRKVKKISMAKKVVERYNSNPDFRFLYERVSDHFAECLKSDLQCLNSGEVSKISLAAKWCPSVDSSFDRSTLLCESIARKVFPREDFPEYRDVEDAHYAYRVRDRLRKDVLVPIRKVLELPEVYIGANQWGLIPYNRVASVAMKFYRDKFMKHDGERFSEYLEKVKEGKATIAAGALLPHKIIESLNDGLDNGEVAVLQWKRMVDDLLKKGKLRNGLAVCDVSLSMNGIPMDVCVALGLLVSELSEEPWKGKVMNIQRKSELHIIKGVDLKSKIEFVKHMEWGANTNFQKVFDRVLEVAVSGNLKKDQMIKKLFVFSDMEFDKASAYPWETDYQAIQRKFAEKGYGSAVPQIVFWNLRNSRATPVLASQNGVALVSGFSKNLLSLFLNEEGLINPEAVMETAISGTEYQKLVVLD